MFDPVGALKEFLQCYFGVFVPRGSGGFAGTSVDHVIALDRAARCLCTKAAFQQVVECVGAVSAGSGSETMDNTAVLLAIRALAVVVHLPGEW